MRRTPSGAFQCAIEAASRCKFETLFCRPADSDGSRNDRLRRALLQNTNANDRVGLTVGSADPSNRVSDDQYGAILQLQGIRYQESEAQPGIGHNGDADRPYHLLFRG